MGLGRKQYRGGMLGLTPEGAIQPMAPTSLNLMFNGGYAGQYGGNQANLWVYRGALMIPAVWRATNLLASLLAQVPWDAYTTHGQDFPTKLDPRPPLLEQPAPPDTQYSTFRSGMFDYIHDGNAIFIVAARNPQGTPTAVWPVPASWVGVRRITPMNVGNSMLPVGAIEYQVGSNQFAAEDIIHVKGPCAPGALRGAGVLEMFLLNTIQTAHEQEREALKMSRHGVPAGILKFLNGQVPDTKTKDGKSATMRTRMQDAADQWLSARDHNGVAVMNDQVDFQPLAWNPNDMQMIQARQFTLLQLANIMGIPPKFVGAASGDSLTYATSETGGKELLRDTMGGHFVQWEQTLSLAFPRGTNVKADLDQFLRSDMLQRYQAYTLAIDAGWLKPSADVRRMENLPPDPKLDENPTASAAKGQNKALSITDLGLKQVTETDVNGNLVQPGAHPAANPAPVQAQATVLPHPALPAAGHRASQLEFGKGSALWDYWVHGEGAAKWMASPTPWATLRTLLITESHGKVPADQVNGLVTNIMQATPAGRILFKQHHGGK